MERLTRRDLRALLNFLRAIDAPCNLHVFQARIFSALPKAIPCEILSYNEINVLARRNEVAQDPPVETLQAILPQYLHIFERYMQQHPLITHYNRTGDTRVLKISDFLSQAQFRRLGLYNELFRPIGVTHQMAVTLSVPPPQSGVLVGIALNRGRLDFSERDRALLTVLRPHLVAAYQRARALANLQNQLALASWALDRVPVGVVLLGQGQRIELANLRARALIAQYFESSSHSAERLPDSLDRWVKHHAVEWARAEEPGAPRGGLIAERQGKRLLVQLVVELDHSLLLLEEHLSAFPPSVLESLGLTRREAEVLAWIIQGKTNADISGILGTSRHTVAHQLQRIFDKLGVETRTAAATLALRTVCRISGCSWVTPTRVT